MNRLIKSLEHRRKALQSVAWLRPVLLATDLVLLVTGLFISPVLGFVFGLLFILLNEWLTPVLVRRIFIKDLSGELKMTGTLTTKLIRHSVPSDVGENQDQPE
jgi:hypothetical protein